MTVIKFFIAPSILSADFLHLADQIHMVEESGADWLHLDVMDGHFVPNLSLGPSIVAACRQATNLPLDVHLMVQDPGSLLETFVDAGADNLTIHVEATDRVAATIDRIHRLGLKAGITLKPATPVSSLVSYLPYVDEVLVMSVEPGFSGQVFLPAAIERISAIKHAMDEVNPTAWLAIDGGITAHTAPLAKKAGAQVFISGNAIFKDPNGIPAAMKALRTSLD